MFYLKIYTLLEKIYRSNAVEILRLMRKIQVEYEISHLQTDELHMLELPNEGTEKLKEMVIESSHKLNKSSSSNRNITDIYLKQVEFNLKRRNSSSSIDYKLELYNKFT